MQEQEIVKPQRRHDIDWLRVILFGLLIWFHFAVFSLGQLEGEESSMELFILPLFKVCLTFCSLLVHPQILPTRFLRLNFALSPP